ncbi:MAG TPA: hypothetical protein VKX25_16205 [Bryobacteraceae bacterium]|jgi:hypothetical protein|nr:hypothetical protein [Bryobacteraceae bacterium]
MSTAAQINANRANSQLSTGPRTPEGKAKVSHNAVKSALTGATVLLPSEEAALYEQHVANTFAVWAPADHREKFLVQSIADTEWRLHRIPALEAATIALARIQNAETFENYPEPLRQMLLEAHILQLCERQLRNLHLQERRLRSYLDKNIRELKELQAERHKQREEELTRAARLYERCSEKQIPFNPSEFGFEFSLPEIEEKLMSLWDRKPAQSKAA